MDLELEIDQRHENAPSVTGSEEDYKLQNVEHLRRGNQLISEQAMALRCYGTRAIRDEVSDLLWQTKSVSRSSSEVPVFHVEQ